jgi:hypothetical protein
MSNELITDIEESIKREKLEQFWDENRNYIIACALLAVLLTGLMSAYRHYTQRAEGRSTALYLAALKETDKAGALVKAEPHLLAGQRAIAELTAAGVYADQGKLADALTEYKKLADAKNAPKTYRQLGALMSVRLGWAQEKDKASAKDADALITRLQPIWADSSSPWQWHAHYEAAQILADAKQDYKGANGHLNSIINAGNIPDSLRERAKALYHVYELKAPSKTN